MIDNSRGVRGARYAVTDRETEMACFDALPRELRDLLNNAPIEFLAAEAYVLAQRYPPNFVVGVYVNNIRAKCPRWRPLKRESVY